MTQNGSPAALRRMNERRVLDMLRSDGPSSQAHLARRAGISRATVHSIVRGLEAAGDVIVTTGVNGRESSVHLATARGVIVAVEVTAQRVQAMVAVLPKERRLDRGVTLTADQYGPAMIPVVVATVRQLLASAGVDEDDVTEVCVAVKSPLDTRTGRTAASVVMPGWEGFDVVSALNEAFGRPVHVDNDANLAALAEWTWGAGRGVDDFLYVRSSNGIGAGIVLGGRIHRGGSGMAGELGHMVLDQDGLLCACGNRGCLSTFVSGRAILHHLAAGGHPRRSLLDVIDGARQGDPACMRVLAEAGTHLGRALANVAQILAPSVIAIGGELAAAGTPVLDAVVTALEQNTLHAGPSIIVRQGMLREDMALLGCVAWSLHERGEGLSELPGWLLRRSTMQPKETV